MFEVMVTIIGFAIFSLVTTRKLKKIYDTIVTTLKEGYENGYNKK